MQNLKRQIIQLREHRNSFLLASLFGGCFGIQFVFEKRWFSFVIHWISSLIGWGLIIYNTFIFFVDASQTESNKINDIAYSGSLTQLSMGLFILFFLLIWWAVDTIITYKKYNQEIEHRTQKLLN
jgi:heme/copper-type cytochrome/quinol oxidase subunit 2